MSTVIFLFSVIFLNFCFVSGALIPTKCRGSCSLVNDCPEAYQLVRKRDADRTQEETDILRKAFCGFEHGIAKVCCNLVRTHNHPNLGLLPADCGFIDGNRVISGEKTAVVEFPWMALVSLRMKGGVDFACGGTVINDRYVLTAAHCVQNRSVAGVRIGEYDIQSDLDCEGTHTVVCADPYQDINIEDVKVHDNYFNDGKNWKHDIALIRLKRRIDLTRNNARPVCLPTSPEEQVRNLDGLTGVVAGWGQTETGLARVLMKAELPIRSQDDCENFFEAENVPARYRTSTKTFLCAGVVGRDTCHRDSGGPLLVVGKHGGFTRYIQYGVVSFGAGKCGSERPSLYSDLVLHVPWILDNLKS